MIELTKIDGQKITINADEIESIESNYDTAISLRSGRKVIVRESSELIRSLVIAYRKECYSELLNLKNSDY